MKTMCNDEPGLEHVRLARSLARLLIISSCGISLISKRRKALNEQIRAPSRIPFVRLIQPVDVQAPEAVVEEKPNEQV